MSRRGVLRGDEILARHAHARKRARLPRNWLRRGIPLAGNVTLGLWVFIDAENRHAGLTIEDEHEARLADLRQGGNHPAVLLDVDEAGRGWQVVIPQLVADVLEVPL